MNIGMVSLGCAKNRVDAEVMLGLLSKAGHMLVNDPSQADVILVNTCGFIGSAKQEAIDAIFEMAQARQEGAKLVVSGCLAQRHPQELLDEIPEIDGLLGIGEIDNIVGAIERIAGGERVAATQRDFAFCKDAPRVLTTKQYSSYLKVADGCDNRCAFCAIPGIRGHFISRPIESVVEEARQMVAQGAKELTLIAQDTTRYGQDLYGKPRLTDLLDQLGQVSNSVWWRILYSYPEMIDEQLLDAMERNPSVCKYLDVPIQHCNEEVLRNMHRRGGRKAIERMYRLVRDRGFTLRTTVLVGFPGETQEQFSELMSFLKDHPFDRLGAFAYSREEGTPAADMPGQLAGREKKRRERMVMEQQQMISKKLLQNRVGDESSVLIEKKTEVGYEGRSQYEAPEIDGIISVKTDRALTEGELVSVRITDYTDHDLEGVLL